LAGAALDNDDDEIDALMAQAHDHDESNLLMRVGRAATILYTHSSSQLFNLAKLNKAAKVIFPEK